MKENKAKKPAAQKQAQEAKKEIQAQEAEEFKLEPTPNEVPAKKKKAKAAANKTTKAAKADNLQKAGKIAADVGVQMWKICTKIGGAGKACLGLIGLSAVPYILIAVLAVFLMLQKKHIEAQQNDIMALGGRINELQGQTALEIVNNRRIYICNMEEIYEKLNVEERNTDFELKIAKLDDDVKAAQKKIKNLKDAKVKGDFTDVYLNSLLAKRDKAVEEYENALHETLAKVNKALAMVAVEQKATTIFRSKAVTTLTKYTVDVTQEVLKKINEMN